METKLNRLCLFVFGWDKWNIVPPKFEYGMLISFTVLPSIINQYKFRIKTRCKIQLERSNTFSIPSRKLFDAGIILKRTANEQIVADPFQELLKLILSSISLLQ